jgi:hypothetical protein
MRVSCSRQQIAHITTTTTTTTITDSSQFKSYTPHTHTPTSTHTRPHTNSYPHPTTQPPSTQTPARTPKHPQLPTPDHTHTLRPSHTPHSPLRSLITLQPPPNRCSMRSHSCLCGSHFLRHRPRHTAHPRPCVYYDSTLHRTSLSHALNLCTDLHTAWFRQQHAATFFSSTPFVQAQSRQWHAATLFSSTPFVQAQSRQQDQQRDGSSHPR